MSKDETVSKHIGTKFFALFFCMMLGFIYTVKVFFDPAFNPMVDLWKIVYVWAVLLFVVTLIIFAAEIMWRYVHKYSEKFPSAQTSPMKFWKLKVLSLTPI